MLHTFGVQVIWIPHSYCNPLPPKPAQAYLTLKLPEASFVSRVDPMVPWHGPRIRNPDRPTITPLHTYMVQGPSKEVRANTTGPKEIPFGLLG